MVDRLGGISVFVECVEAGGFSAAAARLHLSRSAVGKAVARLEERLGVRLFHRTTRSHSLTAEGQLFYEHCKRALETIRIGAASLESGRLEVAGRLRVSMPVLFGRHCVVPVLAELARQHPKLELQLSFTDRALDLIEDGFDLAIRSGRPSAGEGVVLRRLARQHMYVCAAPSYLEARGVPLSIADLAGHDAIAYESLGHLRTWVFPQNDGESVEVVPKARLRLDDLEAIADMAAAGMGLAWLPGWLIQERLRAGALVQVLADQPGFVFDIYALRPQTPHLPYRTRVAIDALAESLPRLVAAAGAERYTGNMRGARRA
ncbi:MAG TPA: LysR family transcriptional regulator [Gammaproteobacteria bacterium]|nr:LysR family transcriptional regulator [Gammaproteobacteria bacterium]